MTDFRALLDTLSRGGARYVLIGGFAANVHGNPRLTVDLDIVYDRAPDNLRRLAEILAPLEPYLRGAPAGLPFRLDEPTLRAGLNFTLTTTLGDLDMLGEVAGGGTYEALRPSAVEVTLFGNRHLCVDLPTLISLKRAAGRRKDIEAVAELEALAEERDRSSEE